MGKNNKQNRSAKKRARKNGSGKNQSKPKSPVFIEMQNPFSSLSKFERDDAIRSIATSSREKIPSLYNDLKQILSEYNPILIAATISVSSLTQSIGKSGTQSSRDSNFLPSHLEYFQALSLTIPQNELGTREPNSAIIQKIHDCLIELFQAIPLSRFDAKLDTSEQERAAISIQERLRLATQFVRNWGVHSKTVEIAYGLYKKFDSSFESHYGFSITQSIAVFQALVDQFESKLNQDRSSFFEATKEKTPVGIWKKYAITKQYGDAEVEFVQEKLHIKSMSRHEIIAFIFNDHQRYFDRITDIDIPDISSRTNIPEEKIDRILSEFSFELGALIDFNPDHLFLNNPIWKNPLLKIGSSFQSIIPFTFFSHIKQCIEARLRAFIDDKVSDWRAEYLESKVNDLITSKFPSAWIKRNFKWREGDVQYENDVLVVIDSHLLIFECKSHKIHEIAMRGGEKKIASAVDNIISDAAMQSWRLKSKIQRVRDKIDVDYQFDQAFPKPISGIYKILRISVTLEDFILTSSDYSDLRIAGWLPKEFRPCPNISLSDFLLICEIFDNPIHFIHYLQRRSELCEKSMLQGDEMDFLGVYTKTLLNYDNIPIHEYGKISLNGMSDLVVKYFEARDEGIVLEKPKPAISGLFQRLINQLEIRKSLRWTEIGCILCDFLPDDQRKLENSIPKLIKNLRKNWRNTEHKNSICYLPPKYGNTGLCYIVCISQTWGNRYDYIKSASSVVFEDERIQTCVIIVKNIDNPDTSYDYLAVQERAT
jgi:hypothetical protein